MSYKFDGLACKNLDVSSRREWILPNGLGGFSMGTVSGINTRRYHGLLVAAISPPTVRMVLLAGIDAFIQSVGNAVGISTNQYPGALYPQGYLSMSSCEIGDEVTWVHDLSEGRIEQKISTVQGKNKVQISYKNLGDAPFHLTLRPLVCHKFYHSNFQEQPGYPQSLQFPKDATIIGHEGVALHLGHVGANRTPVQGWYYRFEHQREVERGLDPRDDLFCPCELAYDLAPGDSVTVVASDSDDISGQTIHSSNESEKSRIQPRLEKAAEKFVVRTEQRSTIIAGYPWFTDWGRDTMISIPGCLLVRGELEMARQILRDYAGQMFQGLIPNRFVDSGEKPDYNTVDATLWFANSIYKCLELEWDAKFAEEMLSALDDVFNWHVAGTLFGIRVDPADGLLTQGTGNVQLTWMDAKIGDWVVTPRHGKPVEINGLWYNALRIMEHLSLRLGRDGKQFSDAAALAIESFDKKFWFEGGGYYFDTVDPNDASLRPNQVLAMATPFPAATGMHAKKALDVVGKELLTSVGLRTLAPGQPGYRPRYEGPMNELDSAYHQGTAWPWLLGPYVTALVRLKGSKAEGKRILREAKDMLTSYGVGGIAEVYDAEQPQRPNGCPWQAWSAAEFLRAWIEDCGGD